MNLYLDNVGKIIDSTIIVDGLTIITGENNSGKTTVGRTLYSIISAVENIQQNALIDMQNFAMRAIERVISNINLYRYTAFRLFRINRGSNASVIKSIFNVNYKQAESIEDILFIIDEKIKKLNNCTEEDIYKFLGEGNKNARKSIVTEFMKQRTGVMKLLNEIKKNLQSDPKLVRYTNAKVITTLKKEFYDQIKGINNESKESKIRLFNGNEIYYDIKLLNNELTSKNEVFLAPAFESSLFIDDVTIVDDMTIKQQISKKDDEYNTSYEDFLNKLPNKLHQEKLLDKLISNVNNLFEENLYKKETEKIIKCMKDVSLGRMTFVKDKYVINGLDIRNLAMGSKMFLIIKTLMERGYCNSKTLLVLDEPETHLHPEWQIILAEMIILLVKYLKTKVILTTHSPDFLLSVDVFTKKHKMRKSTHFYKTAMIGNGKKIKLEKVDEKINEIYAKMTKSFVKLEAMINYEDDSQD
jgi:predicted ATPase